MADVAERKRELRHKFKAGLRSFLAGHSKPVLDAEICNLATRVIYPLRGTRCAAFKALSQEPDLTELISSAPDLKWSYPRMNGENLEFVEPVGTCEFSQGAFGVQEPQCGEIFDVNSLSAVCVPGLAFDRFGGRLGQGKGYYDRALRQYKGQKIGFAYSSQVSDEPLPMTATDVPMDFLVTEKFVIRMKG